MAGLDVRVVGHEHAPGTPVVLLMHGFGMRADDLAPFGASLGLRARFLFPEGPVALSITEGGRAFASRAWWWIDPVRRAASLARGARDLSDEHPDGLPAARACLDALVDEINQRWSPSAIAIGGFSQGAMLACDFALRARDRAQALVLLSTSRIVADEWRGRWPALQGVPVFQSHGHADADLSFDAAQRVADDIRTAGARLTWLPFDGGHETPLLVWRALKRFLADNLPGVTAARVASS